MEDDKKKQLMIGIVIACIVLAVGITLYNSTGGSGKAANRKIFILCSECGESSELSGEELREKMQQAAGEGGIGPMGMMDPMGAAPVLTCPGCGKDAAQMATKCKSCETVFIPDFQAAFTGGGYPDKCPKCGYSEEEKMDQGQ